MTLRIQSEAFETGEIEAALERILVSDPFSNSANLGAFLSFIVHETLAGRADRLKAYTIAVGALDRPEDFDPNENPLVRVQARRLRAALDRYYMTEGRDEPLRILLPIGAYVPVFERSDADEIEQLPEVLPPTDPQPLRPGRFVRRLQILAAALIALAAVLFYIDRTLPPPPSRPDTAVTTRSDTEIPPTDGKDASRVLPLFVVEVDIRRPEPPQFDAELYRRRLEDFAQAFDGNIVVSRRAADAAPPEGQPVYLFHVDVVREGNSTNAFFQLVHAGEARIVRSGVLRLGATTPRAQPEDGKPTRLDDDLALIRDIIQEQGTIGQDLQHLSDLGPELRCLTKAWYYFIDPTAAAHLEARRCLEPVVAANPRLVPALTLLAANYFNEYRQGINRAPGDPIARGEEMLMRALRLAPTCEGPLEQLQNMMLIKRDITAAKIAGRRALDANPDDLSAIANYGSLLARTGEYGPALELLERASDENPAAPKWVNYYTFLALNNLGRTEEADRRVAFFDGADSSLFLTAVILRAHRRGDTATADAAIAELRRIEPDFDSEPAGFLYRRAFAEAVSDRLLADLALAGLKPLPGR